MTAVPTAQTPVSVSGGGARTASPGGPPPLRAPRALPVVLGSLVGLPGFLLLLLGGGLITFVETQRDSSGFLMRGANRLETPAYAVVSEQVRPNRRGFDWGTTGNTVKIKTTSAKPVFVGVGPAAAIDRYLAQAPHLQVPDLGTVEGRTSTRGQRPPPPLAQTFWVAKRSGAGTQTLRWSARDRAWRAVVMNADGSRDVSAKVSIGIRAPHLTTIARGMLAAGTVLLAMAGALLYAGLRDLERRAASREGTIR